jgi:transposase
MEKSTVIAIDLAKTKFEIAVSDEPGRVNRHRRLDRSELLASFAQTPAATVVMEACGSAHHWGRQIEILGHKVVLLPPHQVRPARHPEQDRIARMHHYQWVPRSLMG